MSKILYVYVKGGAPLEHAFPRIAACGELHVLALMPMPEAAREIWLPSCTDITEIVSEFNAAPRGDKLVDLVVEHAKQLGADAVITLSEFAVLLVAQVTHRLGLAGAGQQIVRARDKRLMRETWAATGVPIPRFRRVSTSEDLASAVGELTPPMLLKPAWGAGSVAQLVLHGPDDVASAWEQVAEALAKGGQAGMNELYARDTDRDLLVEEITGGSVDGWYDSPGYGDYLSVEGIVADGVYHPLCITGRLPAIPPFTEVASTAPCVLPVPLQRRIEEVSKHAVDALGLRTCGTHTEIKLGQDGELTVIETGARFGGVMITNEIETVFGIDPIGMLVRQLLGEHVDYPPAMLVHSDRAAASLAVIPADSTGNPWRTTPVWDLSVVDWDRILTPGTTVQPVRAFEYPTGEPVPTYDPSGGSRNWLGVFMVTALDAETLRRDCTAILDNLETALATGTLSTMD